MYWAVSCGDSFPIAGTCNTSYWYHNATIGQPNFASFMSWQSNYSQLHFTEYSPVTVSAVHNVILVFDYP